MTNAPWVVVAKVADSAAAKRTDSCGDMEQLEMLELIHVSDHVTREAADKAAAGKTVENDGWTYAVMSRADFDATAGAGARAA